MRVKSIVARAAQPAPSTLVDVLRSRAAHEKDRVAYAFLPDGETKEEQLTYGELDAQARAIAAAIASIADPGQRALLLYPPGLSFISSFLGCLYAGVVAVPFYPPDQTRVERTANGLQAVAADAQVTIVLTARQMLEMTDILWELAPVLKSLQWLATDVVDTSAAVAWREISHLPEALAYLQYTSGSTDAPRGVMVSHANVIENLARIQERFEHTQASRAVIWLPPYHDMGLVGGLLQPLYAAFPATLLSPISFLQRPLRWLQAISRYRAGVSGGPNFAYDLCVRKISPEQRAALDLSSWELAFCGAEPVRAETIDRFVEAFGPCGFRRNAFYPCYGLAEATLIVSGGLKDAVPVVRNIERRSLEMGRAVEACGGSTGTLPVVGCGRALRHETICIVDPDSRTPSLPCEVGEIWVSGPGVTQGYWNRREETERLFNARLAESAEGRFLRTGDLGFLLDGELFITGRLKDIIVIRGRNLSPSDIELTVGRGHPSLRPGCGAAFSIEVEREEQVVVIHEVYDPGGSELKAVSDAIRQEVAEVHGVEVHSVVLIEPRSIPKTSSGKVQRHACRAAFLAGTLAVLYEWRAGQSPPCGVQREDWPGGREGERRRTPSRAQGQTAELIQDWLVSWLAREVGVWPADIDVRRPFSFYGLVSAGAVSLCGDLEDFLCRKLSPTLLYEHPTIDALTRHLVTGSKVAVSQADICVERRAEAEPVAIIGIGCRFPGADGPESLWRLLRIGGDAITKVPAGRWELGGFRDLGSTASVRPPPDWGGFLEQVDQFDSHFFGISPREAVRIDPQQRLLLEVAWESLEDAGQPSEQLAGSSTGVFIGISTNDYANLQLRDSAVVDGYTVTGNAFSIAANRLSYVLDLRGPSMVVDTACSSSLLAVHLACQSLRNGESSLALAGGVNVILSPAIARSFSSAGIISPDGRCKPFDARADGYVRSEGAGVVVLKLLSRALADGDAIRAVIRGSAVNQDGRSNGMLAPSPQSQAAVLQEAYRYAGVSPGEVQYVEAHGTGTPLGDPIEAQSLGAVLAVGRMPGTRCAIGSVKSNIGHLEAAAGIAGLIKAVLSLEHRMIPASLHFKEPNPRIPFGSLPLRVPKTLEPWPASRGPVLAGVSSFGFGGTNVHVVLEGRPMPTSSDADAALGHQEVVCDDHEAGGSSQTGPSGRQGFVPGDDEATRDGGDTVCGGEDDASSQVHLLTLSARAPEALSALVQAYQERLTGTMRQATWSLRDICYTASTRRSHHEHRLAVLACSREALAESLGAFVSGEVRSGVFAGQASPGVRHKTVFVFPGQGPTWWPVARELLDREVVFRSTLERCDWLLRQRANSSFLKQLTDGEEFHLLRDIGLIQSAFFALQVALAGLWRSWGIEPDAVVGHSVGEVAAAHVAGALELEDALRVVFQRGQLIRRVAGQGSMAVVELPLAEVREELMEYEDRLSVAAANSPTSTVISGELAALGEVLTTLQARSVFCRLLESVDFASHSFQMEPLQSELLRDLAGLEPHAALIPIVSTVTGQPCDGRVFDAAYWSRNLREPVLFLQAVDRLVAGGHDVFVEISPHPTLVSAMNDCLRHHACEGTVLASLRRGKEGRLAILGSAGSLYALGYAVNWSRLYAAGGRYVRLPCYPWQRERCWLEPGNKPTVAREDFGGQAHECQGRQSLPGGHPQKTQSGRDGDDVAAFGTLLDCLYEPCWTPGDQEACQADAASFPHPAMRGEGSWLIFTERSGAGAELSALLTEHGETCVWVFAAERYEQAKPGRYFVNPASPADFERLFTELYLGDALACRGVVHMWSLEAAPTSRTSLASLDLALDLGCTSVLHLVQAMARVRWRNTPRLWIVTRGAQAVVGEREISVSQSPVWGLGRVISQEHPEFGCRRLDLSPGGAPAEMRALIHELLSPDDEDEVAFRHGRRYVHRLVRYDCEDPIS